MAIGFDFGTSNCSVAHIIDKQVHAIPLAQDELYIPSTMCAPSREYISEYIYRCLNISPSDTAGENLLRRAININQQDGLEVHSDEVFFGQEALDLYLDDPRHVYYVKSPKSFLGIIGLKDTQLAFFEDLVCAMMTNIKQKAEAKLAAEITETVIGRPVNFHGRKGDESNRQALSILNKAASRAGFKHVEFQFEPVAAGLDYEATLNTDKNVLIVDIGGGTTDCSMIQMGPRWHGKFERNETLLGHTGRRTGGNDLDIFITFRKFMPEFGFGSQQLSGLPVPIPQFWNCIAINDVEAQRKFYTVENLRQIKQLWKNSGHPEKLNRLIHVHQDTLGHSLVREAEKAKIALAGQESHSAMLTIGKENLMIPLTPEAITTAIEEPVNKIKRLIEEVLVQSAIKPDVIYITGGSARSPILREAIKSVLPNTEIVSGNYFGSVTAGLARWADLCFR
ncbi:Chaperone protein DnaK [Vibrio aerogenes CECT 7868]|uniref:Chaperone protein DnaK n=1 Tax=Vibrio aerogenes CECT 7868 TaxID=1216006 RepID=A0A1M5WIG2_9VIBR|nr:molecular chaperone [Vibrio aerogenes]SHH87024.1 Chaperone protein DnaK [Vibrio aerogenes CECT 7868]